MIYQEGLLNATMTAFTTVVDFLENITSLEENSVNSDGQEEVGRLIQVISRPILIVFGTVGNLLAFYIMRRGSLKNVSTCFYMAMLALADTGKYFFMCVLRKKNSDSKVRLLFYF